MHHDVVLKKTQGSFQILIMILVVQSTLLIYLA